MHNILQIKVIPLSTSSRSIHNVGCFYTNNGLNVFTESLNVTQCENIEVNNDTLVCYLGGVTNFIDSASMTDEKCLEICIITYGFRYAGLNM